MSTSGSVRAQRDVPWFQRVLDNIPFLLVLGVGFPTILYTVWSVVELQHLPSFGEAPHGALHGVGLEGAAATTTPPPATATVGETVTVSMRQMRYVPDTIEIGVGTTVVWVNDDLIDHAVAYGTPDTPATERLFEDSGDFPRGESFSYTFETPGTHPIYCSTVGHYQAGMVMTVIVTEDGR
jgi:plastocyanin